VPKLSELVMIFFCEKIDEFLLYVQKKNHNNNNNNNKMKIFMTPP